MAARKSIGKLNFVERLQGDKVIWMIVLILIMLSVLAVSSSTPLLVLERMKSTPGITRADIITEQLLVCGAGLVIILLIYKLGRTGWLEKISKYCYLACLVPLIMLTAKISVPGVVRPIETNDAVRALYVTGLGQLHVFEFVKIGMILYLAWAVNAYKSKKLPWIDRLSERPRLGFLAKDVWQQFIFIFFPAISIMFLVLPGSNSSALFIGLIMFATIFLGGVGIKDMIIYGVVAALGLFICISAYKASGGQVFNRIGTAVERIARDSEDPERQLLDVPYGSREFYNVLDKVRQPISAKVAVKEGGIFGKGAGNSTQKYVVPVIFGDYMFSFIIEEYGLLGGIVVMILYLSLLARGAIVARNCPEQYEKILVGGLVLLITGQAFLHMLINVDLGPLTGQTLPLISHGRSAFLAFSIAFGIILCISKSAKSRIAREERNSEPIVAPADDNVKSTLDELDAMDL